MANTLRSFYGSNVLAAPAYSFTGSVIKAYVEGFEGGIAPFDRGSLPVVSGISMEALRVS